jgi:hypothetical protein
MLYQESQYYVLNMKLIASNYGLSIDILFFYIKETVQGQGYIKTGLLFVFCFSLAFSSFILSYIEKINPFGCTKSVVK